MEEFAEPICFTAGDFGRSVQANAPARLSAG
jgi:hypothetical protein